MFDWFLFNRSPSAGILVDGFMEGHLLHCRSVLLVDPTEFPGVPFSTKGQIKSSPGIIRSAYLLDRFPPPPPPLPTSPLC